MILFHNERTRSRQRSMRLHFGCIALTSLALAGATDASELTLTSSLDNGIQAATAYFTFNDDGATTTLSIMLINDMTVTGDGTNPQWLQGLFFNLVGAPTLTYTGLGGDSTDAYNDMVILQPGATDSDPDSISAYTDYTVDHFWGLRQDLSAGDLPFGSQQYGLGAAGFGIFSESDVLNFQVGGPVPQLDGSDGGILSGTMLSSGSINLPDGHTDREMVDGGIWLTFDLGAYTFDENSLSDIAFVFGTSFSEIVLVPVPLALPVGLIGLAGMIVGRKRLRRTLAN